MAVRLIATELSKHLAEFSFHLRSLRFYFHLGPVRAALCRQPNPHGDNGIRYNRPLPCDVLATYFNCSTFLTTSAATACVSASMCGCVRARTRF